RGIGDGRPAQRGRGGVYGRLVGRAGQGRRAHLGRVEVVDAAVRTAKETAAVGCHAPHEPAVLVPEGQRSGRRVGGRRDLQGVNDRQARGGRVENHQAVLRGVGHGRPAERRLSRQDGAARGGRLRDRRGQGDGGENLPIAPGTGL